MTRGDGRRNKIRLFVFDSANNIKFPIDIGAQICIIPKPNHLIMRWSMKLTAPRYKLWEKNDSLSLLVLENNLHIRDNRY